MVISGKTRFCKKDNNYLINYIFNVNAKNFKFFQKFEKNGGIPPEHSSL